MLILAALAVAGRRGRADRAPVASRTKLSRRAEHGGERVNDRPAPGRQPRAPGVAVPTVAEKIPVGQTPSYVQVAPNGKFAYITNPGARAITVLNTATDQVSGTIKIPQGPPQFVSFSPDSRTAYVSVYNTRDSVHLIAFIDTATRNVTSTVPVNNRTPGPSTTSPDGRYLYVPNHNMAMSGANENVIDVIDTATKKLIGTIAVPPNPHWVAFGKNGRFTSRTTCPPTVTVLNAAHQQHHQRDPGWRDPAQRSPLARRQPPGGHELQRQRGLRGQHRDRQDVATIPVGRNPLDIAYSPDGRYIYTADNEDNTVTVIDTADNRVIDKVKTGKAPTSISVLPNGRQAYVTDESDGTVEILNLPE